MQTNNHRSDIANFRQEQARQEQAAQQGLHGLAAGISRHQFITARMEQDASNLVQLLQAGKMEACDQAVSEMTRELGRLEEGDSSICHITIDDKIEGKHDA